MQESAGGGHGSGSRDCPLNGRMAIHSLTPAVRFSVSLGRTLNPELPLKAKPLVCEYVLLFAPSVQHFNVGF